MVSSRIGNKLERINLVFNKPQRMAVERLIGQAVEARRGQLSIPRPHLEGLQFDILYALARHARWVRVPLFKDVLVDFLVTEHEIPRSLSESIAGQVLDSCESLLGEDPDFSASDLLQGKIDEEFLTYIFVVAASSDHDAAIRERLGLGAGLLRSLKAAAEALSKPSRYGEHHSPKLFMPDVDTVFAKIMIKLTAAIRTCPWVLDVYRLKYALLEGLDRQRFAALAGDIAGIFDFLCAIGGSGHPGSSGEQTARRGLDEAALGILKDSAVQRVKLGTADFLALLEAAGLIYRADVRRRGKRQDVLWDLTEQAENLTAEAFVAALKKESRGLSGEMAGGESSRLTVALSSLGWRKPYLRQAVAGLDGAALKSIFAGLSAGPRDPCLAECLMSAAIDANELDLAEAIFARFCDGSLPPGVVSSACRVAGAIRARSGVKNRLQAIASDHPSMMVRSAALESLL
ncbi:MAG: hypothetical protein RIQ81_379 [Pseudomonadota bacterium]